jgi:beta-glucosidase
VTVTTPDATRLADALPAGFVLGAATSAYQIEGAPTEDGKGESIWDRFTRRPGSVVDGTTGDVACDHYHRWREDIELMRAMSLDAYRFSVAWTRVLPEGRGRVEPRGLDFYSRLVDGLLDAGIEPWVTLYHWDLPARLEDEGGWTSRRTADAFEAYVDIVSRALGDRVPRWLTINEPWETAFLGYHRGVHAPGRRSLRDALAAVHVQLLAHGRALPAIRANVPGARVGIVLDPSPIRPASDREEDLAAARRMDGHLNRWFLDPVAGRGYPPDMVDLYASDAPRVADGDLDLIAAPIDVLGLNEYFPMWVADEPAEAPLRVRSVIPDGVPLTAMGWPIDPDAMAESLVGIAADRPGLSLVVTESGAAFEDVPQANGGVDDRDRLAYHAAHLAAVVRARDAGAPVDGYFAWSLLDNFEWAYGMSRRFGLIRVDEALGRTPKASGRWYAELCARHRARRR